jgi:hypothetical protein
LGFRVGGSKIREKVTSKSCRGTGISGAEPRISSGGRSIVIAGSSTFIDDRERSRRDQEMSIVGPSQFVGDTSPSVGDRSPRILGWRIQVRSTSISGGEPTVWSRGSPLSFGDPWLSVIGSSTSIGRSPLCVADPSTDVDGPGTVGIVPGMSSDGPKISGEGPRLDERVRSPNIVDPSLALSVSLSRERWRLGDLQEEIVRRDHFFSRVAARASNFNDLSCT